MKKIVSLLLITLMIIIPANTASAKSISNGDFVVSPNSYFPEISQTNTYSVLSGIPAIDAQVNFNYCWVDHENKWQINSINWNS